ncbi:MAG: hypothetical protein KAT90_03200, partial [Gammaproteobacteria bacterium]|nr:hypothetical protein [Gammaproteobacteria bacterium]
MLNRQTKILTFILLLMFSSSQMVSAGPKLYKYDGKMPFVQMMLSMMVAMGIIDRYPTNGRYGLSSSPYSRFNNPYMSSPWSRTGLNDPSYDAPLWGNPSWGVLPMESYTQNYYAPYDS